MKLRWKQYLFYTSLIIIGCGFIYILVETISAKNTGFETKTLWDWMQLLVIPLFLSGGAFFLNRSERNTEREIAIDRQQETALQAYLDRMEDLLLKEKLRTTKKVEVRNVARTRTLTVLRGLDSKRKQLVIYFLREIRLINGKSPIISLQDADLSYVDFREGFLSDVNLSGTDLRYAHLDKAFWSGANLSATDLRNTNLRNAVFHVVDLSYADLSGADLTNADLSNSNLTGTNLNRAKVADEQLGKAFSLKGATMPDGTTHK